MFSIIEELIKNFSSRSILQLLQANVTPASLFQLLSELAVTRNQEKLRRQKIHKSVDEKLTV